MNQSIEAIRRLHESGLPCKTIARSLNQTYWTTYRQMSAIGIMRRKPQLPCDVRDRIRSAINEGKLCYAEIARQNHTNKSTVLRIAQRMAIEAEQEDQWGSDDDENDIPIERLRTPIRCSGCGRVVTVSPCVACLAMQNATQQLGFLG